MPGPVLLVSNPPHPRVDPQVAAAVLGIPPAEASLKARYSIPEIWVAEMDGAQIEKDLRRLTKADMRAVSVRAAEYCDVAPQQLVRSFSFGESGIVLHLADGTRAIGADEPVIILSITPRIAEGGPPAARVPIAPGVHVLETCATYDLYLPGGERLAIYAELCSFDALGSERTPSQSTNMVVLGQQLRQRLRNAVFDDRLLNLQLRRNRGASTTLRDTRKGYSYASPGLDSLLAELSPELENISQVEHSSRLCYLTTRAST